MVGGTNHRHLVKLLVVPFNGQPNNESQSVAHFSVTDEVLCQEELGRVILLSSL